jgi:hypothetical protein
MRFKALLQSMCCSLRNRLTYKMTQTLRTSDLVAQHSAMQKLGFLVGSWAGHGRSFRSGEALEFAQTERVEYKLDGLLLLIEGTGHAASDGKRIVQALGILSYDDATNMYMMRAYNDGRFLETEVKLDAAGKELRWGFALGEIRTKSVLRMNEQGQWTELHEITVGSEPSRKFMELTVSRQK